MHNCRGMRGTSEFLPRDDLAASLTKAEVAIERQLPGGLDFTAAYDFTRGVKLPAHFDANLANPTDTGTFKSYDIMSSAVAGATTLQTVSEPFFTTRLEPNAAGILIEASDVVSMYNAMVLSVRKPLSHGIELLANYTLSRSTDDGMSGQNIGGGMFFSSDGVLDPYNTHLEEGRSSTDTPNRFVASVVWAPAYGKNLSNRFERGIIAGWNLSSTITATSGSRYSALLLSSTQQCLIVATTCPAGDLSVDSGMTGAILNSNGQFSPGRAAFLPRNSEQLPNYTNVDFRLTKGFNVREKVNIEFRAEAFNLFNSLLVLAVNQTGYTFAQPSAGGACAGHTNTCIVPQAGFQADTTTTGNLLGARQLQFGLRFNF